MKNYVQAGVKIPLLAPYNVSGGDGMLVGALFSVACGAALQGAPVEGCTLGVFDLKAKAADDMTAGQLVYWDDAAREITETAGANKVVGCVTAAKAAGATVARVRLNGVAA